ncbi:TPA: hypothetical protein DCZ36_02055, partial [Candidatus Gracilibacteria bacterium]|nr:hypothetical protein [Candidatus Gracilibacteria bacterium]
SVIYMGDNGYISVLHKKRKIINMIKLRTKKGTEKSVVLKKLSVVYRKMRKSKKILTLLVF